MSLDFWTFGDSSRQILAIGCTSKGLTTCGGVVLTHEDTWTTCACLGGGGGGGLQFFSLVCLRSGMSEPRGQIPDPAGALGLMHAVIQP